MMTSKENYKPFMVYLRPSDISKLKTFAKKCKLPMTQIVRESIKLRMTEDNPYVDGFNDGLDQAMKSVVSMEESQIIFPTGKSFAQLVKIKLDGEKMKIPV